jgi:hypothetical protein
MHHDHRLTSAILTRKEKRDEPGVRNPAFGSRLPSRVCSDYTVSAGSPKSQAIELATIETSPPGSEA